MFANEQISKVCQPQIFFTSANLKSANFYKVLHNFVSKQLWNSENPSLGYFYHPTMQVRVKLPKYNLKSMPSGGIMQQHLDLLFLFFSFGWLVCSSHGLNPGHGSSSWSNGGSSWTLKANNGAMESNPGLVNALIGAMETHHEQWRPILVRRG
jgi:hypothetical protein